MDPIHVPLSEIKYTLNSSFLQNYFTSSSASYPFIYSFIKAFETPVLKTEFERISNRQPMELMSMKRYELPVPTQKTDLAAWTEALKVSPPFTYIFHDELIRMYQTNKLNKGANLDWTNYYDST